MPEIADRRQRRASQSRADRARRPASPKGTPKPTRARRRVIVAAIAGAAAVAIVVVLVGGGSSPPGHPRLTDRTVLRIPAVSAVAQVGGHSWATDDIRDVAVRFDPSDGRSLQTVHLDGRPVAMLAFDGDLWVANMVSNTVQELSPVTGRIVRTVPVPAGPSGLAALDGRIWFTSLTAASVGALDPHSGRVVVTAPVAAGAVRIASGFGALWVTGTSNQLTELQPRSGTAAPAAHSLVVGDGPIGVATGAGSVWVADTEGGTVVRVDPTDRRVVQTYRTGGQPLALAVFGGRVWVADGQGQTLRTVFPGAGLAPIELHAGPRSLLGAGADLWVAASNPGRVLSAEVTSHP